MVRFIGGPLLADCSRSRPRGFEPRADGDALPEADLQAPHHTTSKTPHQGSIVGLVRAYKSAGLRTGAHWWVPANPA